MIDIKELTINSTVLFKEERVKVIIVDTDFMNDFKLISVKNKDEDIKHIEPDYLYPIPITEELLKELGFEKNNGIGGYDYKKDFDKCAVFVTMIDEWCRFETWDEKSLKNFGNILCQHLHQAESFVYSTIKKELL